MCVYDGPIIIGKTRFFTHVYYVYFSEPVLYISACVFVTSIVALSNNRVCLKRQKSFETEQL